MWLTLSRCAHALTTPAARCLLLLECVAARLPRCFPAPACPALISKNCATPLANTPPPNTTRVSKVKALGASASQLLGGPIDAWIINAGQSGSFKSFVEASDEALEQVGV